MAEPLVTVVVPVYNGAAYLRECLDSVVAQTYRNWRLIVLNNSSTDATPQIAAEYASRDARVSVHSTDRLLPIIENHNHALSFLDADAKYCKPLMADDWIFPECLQQMVAVAERNPSVGLVDAYAFDGRRVMWEGPPYPAECLPGRQVCRASLLGEYYVFGTPSTALIRADLVRKQPRFYNEENVNADVEASYQVLGESDFGFVHQVLVFNRVHEQSMTAALSSFNAYVLGTLHAFKRFGRLYLSDAEFEARREAMLRGHYRNLAKNVLRIRDSAFWQQQRARLEKAGEPLDRGRLARAVAGELLRALGRPFDALEGVGNWWSSAALRAIGSRKGSGGRQSNGA